ncbi:hypothetical protein R3W88_026631 [Solanum pinnatisectum]|uniref:Uncharacterized protein n=1 Tax=Solanum pinnatisectum TaxID=50273 RepID=A0AAV9LHK1_9SOLN|nr:hypothetical protein R3W88_026631 [Solanum pinnatisectum]
MKLHLINWDTITSKKAQGGLGIHKAEIKNRANHTTLIRGLSHVYMEQIRVADAMGKEGMKKQHFDNVEVLLVPPVFVQKIVEADTLGTMYVRHLNTLFGISQGRDMAQTNTTTTNVQLNTAEAQDSIGENT